MTINENFEEISKEINNLNNKFKKEVVEKKTQVDWLNSELDRLIKLVEEAQSKERSIDSNLNKKNSRLVELDKQIFDKNQAANMLQDLKSEISSGTIEKNHLLEEIIDINRKVSEIRNELSGVSKDKETVLGEIRNIERDKNTIFTNIEAYTKEASIKQKKISELDAKNALVGEQIVDSERILKEINGNIESKNIEFAEIKDKIVISRSENDGLTNDKDTMILTINANKSELEDIKDKCYIEKNKISHERDRLLSVRKEILQTIMNNRKIMDSNKIAEFIKSVREDDNGSGSRERTNKE